jgi:hypothetical protein
MTGLVIASEAAGAAFPIPPFWLTPLSTNASVMGGCDCSRLEPTMLAAGAHAARTRATTTINTIDILFIFSSMFLEFPFHP